MVCCTPPASVTPLLLLIPNRWTYDNSRKRLGLKRLPQANEMRRANTTILVQKSDPFGARLPGHLHTTIEAASQATTITVGHNLKAREEITIGRSRTRVVINDNHIQARMQECVQIGSDIFSRILPIERDNHGMQTPITLEAHLLLAHH